jgi:ferritin
MEKDNTLKDKFMENIKKMESSKDTNEEVKETKPTETKTNGIELYKLDSKTIQILTDRIKDEYIAHYYYRAAANWCQDMNYKKAAEFFKNEADDELTHAKGIQEYMVDFNIIPQIPQAPTSHSFDSLVDIIYGAYKIELALMKEYNKNSQELFASDITTFDFLKKYRNFQKGAVVEYNDLINAIDLVDKTDKFQILYFEQTYF